MRVAIIGGGFTGLSAAIELVDKGTKVSVFEQNDQLGGLALGFQPKDWEWPLEVFYHHIFQNDTAIIKLAQKVNHPAFFQTPLTNTFRLDLNAPLDTPLTLLTHPQFSLWSKFRLSLGLLELKLRNSTQGQALEKYRVVDWLPAHVGQEAYDKLWFPLLSAKFGPYLPEVNMAWFWARIAKRTKSLGYFEGGFMGLLKAMGKYIEQNEGNIYLGSPVVQVKKSGKQFVVNGAKFDKVLVTTPAPLVDKLIGPNKITWPKINYLWGQTLIIELKESLLSNYWLNILEDWPFLVAVEHTNFIDKKQYAGKPLVYLGNYLPEGDKRLKMSAEKLLEMYTPFIKKINPEFKSSWVGRSWKFQLPFSQPVFPINYSSQIPTFDSGIPGIFVANMSMVYPWDRGTNYAVELGQKVAQDILSL